MHCGAHLTMQVTMRDGSGRNRTVDGGRAPPTLSSAAAFGGSGGLPAALQAGATMAELRAGFQEFTRKKGKEEGKREKKGREGGGREDRGEGGKTCHILLWISLPDRQDLLLHPACLF